jgi:hypothetical protein
MKQVIATPDGGIEVDLTATEIAEFRAREAEYAAGHGARLLQSAPLAVQALLDSFAQTRGYDGILSACSYATDPDPAFSAEGQYCVGLRSRTWAALRVMLAEVEAGSRPIPSGFDEIAGELPTASAAWPT